MANPFDMLKQMGKLNSQMDVIKDEMKNIRGTGSAGAGMVEVTLNGEYQVEKIHIAPEMLTLDTPATLEVLLTSAFNDAGNKVKENLETTMRARLASMGIVQ